MNEKNVLPTAQRIERVDLTRLDFEDALYLQMPSFKCRLVILVIVEPPRKDLSTGKCLSKGKVRVFEGWDYAPNCKPIGVLDVRPILISRGMSIKKVLPRHPNMPIIDIFHDPADPFFEHP